MARWIMILSFAACAQPLPELAASVAEGCGNGRVETGEECDDGNINDRDACTNSCLRAICGDQILRADLPAGTEGFERCDDGDFDEVFCTRHCQPPRCGDGIVLEGREECDDGNLSNVDDCLNTCTLARCGDGHQQEGEATTEACDDGNAIQTDECLNDCTTASCGDGFVHQGVEGCDDGNDVETDDCLSSCEAASCGDGFLWDGQEQCDDGNQSNTDACTVTCHHARCGDGLIRSDLEAGERGYEACDDNNVLAEDECSPDCLVDDFGNFFETAFTLPVSDALHNAYTYGQVTPGDTDLFSHRATRTGRHIVEFEIASDVGEFFCQVYGADQQLVARVAGPREAHPVRGTRSCRQALFLEAGETGWWAIENGSDRDLDFAAILTTPCGNGSIDPGEECDPNHDDYAPASCRLDCRMRRIMAMGEDFVCMMQNDDLICWGRNTNLILGEDLPEDHQQICTESGVAASSATRPVVVASNLPPGTEAVAHRGRVCYRRPDERVFCWGKMLDMENVATWSFCGDASDEARALEYPGGRHCVATPTEIDVPDGAENRLKQIALGGYGGLLQQECVLKGFSVYCRGDNFTGSMGLGPDSGDSYHADWQEVTGISSFADYLGSGAAHSCIIERFIHTSLVSCWGINLHGEVGVDRVIHQACDGWPCEHTAQRLGYLNDDEPGFGLAPSTTETVALSVGYKHNCSVNLTGQVLCWGLNTYGQTGQPPGTEWCNVPGVQGDDVSCTTSPTLVEGMPPMVDVSVGAAHSCALSQTGQIWCWGDGGIGNLGTGVSRDENGDRYGSAAPVRIGLLPRMKHIATRHDTTCAISLAGDMYCWGNNAYGQCALGDCNTYQLQPVVSPLVNP